MRGHGHSQDRQQAPTGGTIPSHDVNTFPELIPGLGFPALNTLSTLSATAYFSAFFCARLSLLFLNPPQRLHAHTGDDYLVDHSIIHYLINPAGEFVTFYAKSFSAEQMAESIAGHLADWQEAHPEYHKGHRIDKPVPAKP